MNIAHFETSMDWGGQELRIVEQAEWLNQHGYPTWIIARPGSAILAKAQEKNLPTFAIRVRGSRYTQRPLHRLFLPPYLQTGIVS